MVSPSSLLFDFPSRFFPESLALVLTSPDFDFKQRKRVIISEANPILALMQGEENMRERERH